MREIKVPFQEKNNLPIYVENKVWIYILSDPTNISLTCYVGKAIDAQDRYKRHLWPSELISNGSNERYLHNWVISLLRRGVEPIMVILDQVPEAEFAEAECFYISYYRSIGMDLCNLTDGGEGTSGYKHTDEGIEKMRQAKLGIPMAEEIKLKRMRQDLLQDIDHIKKIYFDGYSLLEIAELYNTSHSTITLHLEKSGVEIREEKYTERYIDKLRVAQTGKIFTEATKQKMASSKIGHVVSDETRAKMSATRIEQLATGEVTMPTNRASGKEAGHYRDDVEDDMLIKLYNNGLSLRKIGQEVDMEHHAVKNRLIQAGVVFNDNVKKDTSNFVFNIEKALELYKVGHSCNAIGKDLGCDSKVVKKYLIKAGIVFNKPANEHKQLDDKMDRIKELYDRSFTYAEIGRMMNTSGNTIKSYLKKYNVI